MSAANALTRLVDLPLLGSCLVAPDPAEAGHYWWLSLTGWHDCNPAEDAVADIAFADARPTLVPPAVPAAPDPGEAP
jgi:hypothetical protein